eukprot:COSAG04_NODE_267_length_18528_cov_60.607141_20_plen_75_part_00
MLVLVLVLALVLALVLVLVLIMPAPNPTLPAGNSYELLSLLRSRNLPMPLRVFYSCFPPPTIPLNERPWTPNAQ